MWQQDKNLEKSKEQNNIGVIQYCLHNILLLLYSGLAISKDSISSKLMKKNITFENALLLFNQNSSIISKNTTKLKQTYCNQSHSLASKHAKVIGSQKLAELIYIVVEELKFFYKEKIKSIKKVVK